jgi:hypothetical protein
MGNFFENLSGVIIEPRAPAAVILKQEFSAVADRKIQFAGVLRRVGHESSCHKFIVVLVEGRLVEKRVGDRELATLFAGDKNKMLGNSTGIQIDSHHDGKAILTKNVSEILASSCQICA